jgi:photosystem II stability/assembly factor-like uncharacterized protein
LTGSICGHDAEILRKKQMETPSLKAKKGVKTGKSKGPILSAVTMKPDRGRAFRPQKPEGGKALARIQQFRLERGFPLLDLENPEPREVPIRSEARGKARPAISKRESKTASPYLAAFHTLEKMPSDLMGPAVPVAQGWRPIGPFSVPHGQTYGAGPGSRPPVSGRVAGIAIDPSNANHILCGSGGGGVWETRDGGTTWEPRTDNQPSLSIGAVAFDPSNPLIAYAGTGEGDTRRGALGVGLLRSADGGTSWTVHATAPFVGLAFFDIAIDPTNTNHILAATTGGLFESANAGSTWTLRRGSLTFDLSFHPVNSAEVFAACDDGLFRSTNGGTAWTAVALPSSPASFARVEVCHAPSNGNIVYVFAAGSADTGHLWRRNIFGGAFAVELIPPSLDAGQGWYDWFAAVAPNNPDLLYVAGIDAHKGVRSTSGVWSWTDISAKTAGDSIHPDQHCIAFSPTNPNIVYIGCDGGIYRSPDGGITWKSLNKGLCITEFEYLAQHPQWEAFLIGGTQDNGTLRYEGSEVWFHVQDGDGGDCGVNASTPYTCFHTFFNMGLERSTTGGGWGSWSWIELSSPSLFYPPVEVRNNIVVQAGTIVFISDSNGTAFASVALPAVAGRASALAIASSTTVYVGTENGRIYRIDKNGATWQTPVALTRPTSGFVRDIEVDPQNPGRIWVTYSATAGGRIYRTTDGGTTWTNISTGLPDIPFNSLAVDPANTNNIWASADVGVYRSPDGGTTWTNFSNGLPNAICYDLLFHATSRLLRVGTQSRGAWEINVDVATMPNVEVYLRDSTVDTGRVSPSPSGVPDPFSFGSVTQWWQSTDLKVDSPSYQRSLLTDVDFEIFEDDHGVFFQGLVHENAQRGKTVRVYVQAHNRGIVSASNVAVKVFFADASLGLPNLPAGFWTGFPNNVILPGNPWQAIAPHVIIPSIQPGRSQVIGFLWNVPATAADHTCLLAITTADNDSLVTGTLNIATLVTSEKKCGLKNLSVVNPPPGIGPRVLGLKLNLWATKEGGREYSIGCDRKPAKMVRGLVLSKALAKLAKASGLKSTRLALDDQAEIARLADRHPELRESHDLKTMFISREAGSWLRGLKLSTKQPEEILVLLEPKPTPGRWSLYQTDTYGNVVGGFTLQCNDDRQ